MPTLEEKIQMLGGQNATRTNGQPNTQPEGEAQESWFFRAPAQFNVGLAQMLGLPKVGADLLRNFSGYEEESALPTGFSKMLEPQLSRLEAWQPRGFEQRHRMWPKAWPLLVGLPEGKPWRRQRGAKITP
jgi:hypothetical protein